MNGELHEVNDVMMEKLDELEDLNVNYHKIIIPVQRVSGCGDPSPSTGVTDHAACYVVKDFKPELLNEDMYETYDSNGSHGRKFMQEAFMDPDAEHPFAQIKINYHPKINK